MGPVQSADLQRVGESKSGPGVGREGVRQEHRSILGDREEAGVERRVEMGREQEAVEDIEALSVRAAVGLGACAAEDSLMKMSCF